MAIRRGDLVTLNGRLAAVVGVEGDPGIPEDHVGLWYGDPPTQRQDDDKPVAVAPIVYTVPAECCRPSFSTETMGSRTRNVDPRPTTLGPRASRPPRGRSPRIWDIGMVPPP
jgi:hypothetical protein